MLQDIYLKHPHCWTHLRISVLYRVDLLSSSASSRGVVMLKYLGDTQVSSIQKKEIRVRSFLQVYYSDKRKLSNWKWFTKTEYDPWFEIPQQTHCTIAQLIYSSINAFMILRLEIRKCILIFRRWIDLSKFMWELNVNIISVSTTLLEKTRKYVPPLL